MPVGLVESRVYKNRAFDASSIPHLALDEASHHLSHQSIAGSRERARREWCVVYASVVVHPRANLLSVAPPALAQM